MSHNSIPLSPLRRIGVVTLPPYQEAGALRRLLLLFDTLGVRFGGKSANDRAIAPTLDTLAERGVLFDTRPYLRQWFRDPEAAKLQRTAHGVARAVEQHIISLAAPHMHDPKRVADEVLPNIPLVEAALANFDRALAAELRRAHSLNATAFVSAAPFSDDAPREAAVRVVLHAVPSPSDSVDWEALLEFRNDPDVQASINRLWVWMHDMGRTQLSEGEIADRLRSLLDEYEGCMRLHRMKAATTALEAIITVAADVAENVARFKFGGAARALFALTRTDVSLLEAERSAPGREVAFMSHVKSRLAVG